ncbi:linoleate diol synthase [Lecanosticta acicola]|uniref:Linoleate diol synthase n=1 Tax=Lecanosticta acicola TaxID=111012 RepID=A0AAI9E8W8_9PEZI|nr:linoleate diol synthase [Lecanosticta acicola]
MAPGQIKMLIGSIRRKPTTAPDRRTDDDAAANAKIEKTSIMHDIVHGSLKEKKFMAQALTTLASGEPMNDKELLLENGVSMLQSLPPTSGLSSTVSDGFIKMLYNDLPHPSASIAGPTARYRRHDGGNNNLWNPEMGKAGTPYARNVPPMKPKGPNLPDPELVFEQLLKRDEKKFREHPSGLNRLFFSFATIVIHECFQTNRENQWINETSSYVDLSTLYGNTEKEQPRVRTYKDGMLYPDAIASDRIMLMPPGVVALLVMFSRNHNAIVKNLLSVNEQGKYKPWDHLDEEKQKWQDEDLFQIGRNINVGFFATVVLKDYVAAILNTPRADSTWSLDLGKEIKNAGQRVERGTGNVVSVEFAVLYHWHAALSAADAKWMEDLIRWHNPEMKSLDEMTPLHFRKVVEAEAVKLRSTPGGPPRWTFDKYKRGADGRFDDVELAELLKDCIEEPAHAFGAHGTPASLKVVDVMGQLQARNMFNVCTMNEFRQYLNLKPYESFEEWCEDRETARAAELLYSHIDNLELYPGLMAECTKPAMPGSGVCPGQTTGRGILDDAVALVRGDRYLSYDFNSNTLTNYGVSKLGVLPGGSYGGMLPRLLYTGLPTAFTGTSSYALLQFYTPKAAKEILKANKVLGQYDTKRPRSDLSLAAVHTSEGCKNVFEDRETFRILNGQKPPSPSLQKVFLEDGVEAKITRFFSSDAAKLIKARSLKYPGSRRSIDIVRDVTNATPVRWLAERLAIPIKTMESPRGIYSIPQVFDIFLGIFFYSHQNILPINEWKLREASTTKGANLKKIIETHLKTQSGFKERIVDFVEKGSAFEVGPDADRLYHALNDTKQPIANLVQACVDFAAPIAATITQQASLLIDLFLTPHYSEYRERIIELAHRDDAASEEELQGFVFEGIRHAGAIPGIPRWVSRDTTIQDGAAGHLQLKQGQTVLIGTSRAAMDPTLFAEPEKLNPRRPRELYSVFGSSLPDLKVVGPAIAAMLREVFKLKGLRRANGKQGCFTIVENDVAGLKIRQYLDANAKEVAAPTSLMVEYEE